MADRWNRKVRDFPLLKLPSCPSEDLEERLYEAEVEILGKDGQFSPKKGNAGKSTFSRMDGISKG